MQKNPIVKTPSVEEKDKFQGKRKRKETVCSDKRRDHNCCGICGSSDLVYEQVVYCKKCGKEIFNIGTTILWRCKIIEYPCNCLGEVYLTYKGKEFRHKVHFDFSNRVCLTCGSVESLTCPVCNKNPKIPSYYQRGCWTSPTGEKFCRGCGFKQKSFEIKG